MRRVLSQFIVLIVLIFVRSAVAQERGDAEDCKDHQLFNRMPGYYIAACDHADFEMRKFPVGPPLAEDKPKLVEIEGILTYLSYSVVEGGERASGLQIMRNFQNAAKAAGGSVEGEYPDWCTANVDYDSRLGNTCTNWGTTVTLKKGDLEIWAYVQMQDEGTYGMQIVERKAMKQDIAVNEMLEKINKDGFIALYINFDTGKSTIKPDSTTTIDDVAAALKAAPDLKLEVAGHTDNVGTPESNQSLSQKRAEAVIDALVSRGIAASRLTARGYGQTVPIADNRSDDGRTKNRRVELVKK